MQGNFHGYVMFVAQNKIGIFSVNNFSYNNSYQSGTISLVPIRLSMKTRTNFQTITSKWNLLEFL